MSKAKLLFDLIMYVNTKRKFTAQEVAEEFQVSVRTAHRYLLELSEWGVPLYTEQGRHGGYRILNNRMLPPILFDEDEAFAIFFAFQSLASYSSLPFELNMATASRKLLAGFPDDTRSMISQLQSVLAFWNPKRCVSSPYLKEILDAALHHRVVRVTYRSKANTKKRELKPIGVYAYNGLWYMPAYDLQKQEIRLFRVDRIESFALSETTTDFNMNLAEYFQAYQVKDPLHLYATLTQEGIRQCLSMPWFDEDLIIQDCDHGIIDTTIDRSELEFVAQIFLQLGTAAKVIQPKEVVDLIRAKACRLMDHYPPD